MPELTMDQMAAKFAAEHAAPLTREVLAELLSDYVDNEYVLDAMFDVYRETLTEARRLTPEEAASRDLQEIIWDKHEVLRFRENKMVTTLLEQGPNAVTKGFGTWAGRQRFIHWERNWELDQFKYLLKIKDPIILWLLENGPADMNRLAVVDFPQESRERFAMLIGYSVSGAGDLSYFSDAMYNRARAECERMIAEKEE